MALQHLRTLQTACLQFCIPHAVAAVTGKGFMHCGFLQQPPEAQAQLSPHVRAELVYIHTYYINTINSINILTGVHTFILV